MLLLPAFLVSRQVTSPGVGGEDPGVPEGPINVLIIGTDGEMGTPAYRFGARSDTMILAHLSADRKRTTILNIPRDTMVMIHGCGSAPARLNMINQAYDIGGLGCAVKTVESVTGLRVDHGMEFDFSGFKSMVDALGGVEVHLPRPVDDPKAKLTLPAGRHVVNGETALAYARLRYYGDGSDLQRIKRQQWLMSAMVKKARESLTDPARLYAFLREVMDSVKTTDGFDLETLATLARSLERTVPSPTSRLHGGRTPPTGTGSSSSDPRRTRCSTRSGGTTPLRCAPAACVPSASDHAIGDVAATRTWQPGAGNQGVGNRGEDADGGRTRPAGAGSSALATHTPGVTRVAAIVAAFPLVESAAGSGR